MAEDTCSHLNAISKVKHPTRRECEECVNIGASWVVIASAEPGERWLYCYPDDAFAEY